MTDPTALSEPRRRSRRRTAALAAAAATAVFGLAAAIFVGHGREQTFMDLYGDPDTGPYDFSAPTRTPYPHDALACPAGACGTARPDFTTPIFQADPGAVFGAAKAAVTALPRPDVRLDAPESGDFRAVVRTPWLRFPDTVSVAVRPHQGGGSSLWIYSRSQIGRNDWGTNRRRVAAVIADIEQRLGLPAAAP